MLQFPPCFAAPGQVLQVVLEAVPSEKVILITVPCCGVGEGTLEGGAKSSPDLSKYVCHGNKELD